MNEWTDYEEQRNARRYLWLRAHWDEVTGLTWRDPAKSLDAWVDEQMAKPVTLEVQDVVHAMGVTYEKGGA